MRIVYVSVAPSGAAQPIRCVMKTAENWADGGKGLWEVPRGWGRAICGSRSKPNTSGVRSAFIAATEVAPGLAPSLLNGQFIVDGMNAFSASRGADDGFDLRLACYRTR